MEQKLIFDQHTEHLEWLNKLAFYKDEIKILKNRLSEIASNNNSREVRAHIEHFENQFIVQQEQNDILRHAIKQHENLIQQSVDQNPTASDHRKMDDHVQVRDSVDTYERIFSELRKELNEFLAKWI